MAFLYHANDITLTGGAEWLGGGSSVPWRHVLADTEFTFVQPQRLPAGQTSLLDPRKASKELCIVWYHHLRALGEDRFQFRRVLNDSGKVVATYESTCIKRHPESTLTWGAPAKLYALHIDRQRNPSSNTRAWKSLPFARTVGIYVPVPAATLDNLRPLSQGLVDLCKLAELVNTLEKYGPAHVSISHHVTVITD